LGGARISQAHRAISRTAAGVSRLSDAAGGAHTRLERLAVDFGERGIQDRNITGEFLGLPPD
jgi:hypothetical protein